MLLPMAATMAVLEVIADPTRRERDALQAARASFRDLVLSASSQVRLSTFALENDAVVESFLAGRPDFQPVPRATLLAEGMPEAVLDREGRLVTRPDLHGLEPFFAAPLERAA